MNPWLESELGAWLRLAMTPGVGRETARKLLAAFGEPLAIFAQSPDLLASVVSPRLIGALQKVPQDLEAEVNRTLLWLQQSPQHALLTLGDARYPNALLNIEDPPVMLFASGQLALLDNPLAVAVVGSRHPSPQGLIDAQSFSAHLSEAGITVVSGLARGIDTAAHQGALRHAASTIAVVGTGLDQVYPAQNTELALTIAEKGLLLSEYPLGTPPLASHFPQRNRLISGLSAGTLVVEAALRSGSLITARMALEQGKEVFAIPGSIHSPVAKGCHALIKQGAKLVESAQDILEEFHSNWADLGGQADRQGPAFTSHSHDGRDVPVGNALLAAMGYEPVSLDDLQDRTGWAASELQVQLLDLELEHHILRLPGGRFQRVNRA